MGPGEPADQPFSLRDVLTERGAERYDLHRRYLNPQLPRMLHAIGFDKIYTRAQGAYLYDADGEQYLDMLAGFGVFALGRHHPVVRQAIHDVVDADLADLTQFDAPPLAGPLAEALLAKVPHLDRVYFGNSGTEAVEAALKFARFATGRRRIIYCDHAFHGLTAGSLSVNGSNAFRKGFGPMLPDTAIPFGDLRALERELRRGDVAGFLIEPIQGKGVAVSPPGFLPAAQELLRAHKALLIADEVQCGVGRTGDFFAFQNEDVEPDLIAAAKALSGGYIPIGATIGREWIFAKVYSSMDRVLVHDSTFGSNAQAMAAGLATLHVLEHENVIDNARKMGELLQSRLAELVDRYELLHEVRGRGLMIGIVVACAPDRIKELCMDRGLLVLTAGADVVRLLPPLVIADAEIDRGLGLLKDALDGAR